MGAPVEASAEANVDGVVAEEDTAAEKTETIIEEKETGTGSGE